KDNQSGAILAAKRIPLDNWDHVDALQNEARALQNLNNPYIPAYRDFYVQEDVSWGNPEYVLVTDYVAGESLSQKLQSGRRYNEEELTNIKAQVLDALNEAHRKGIVHRDIKPANIMLDEQNNVKVTDFGIAKFLGEKPRTRTLGAGSAFYMAPEQVKGEEITPATDYYGLGITLLAIASGREADYEMEMDPLEQLGKLNLSESFRESLKLMLSADPQKRKEGLVEKAEETRKVNLNGYISKEKTELPVKGKKITVQLPEIYTVLKQNHFIWPANIARHVGGNQEGVFVGANIAHIVGGYQFGVLAVANIAHTVGGNQEGVFVAANIAHTVGRDQWGVLAAANIAHTVGRDQIGLVNIVYGETRGNQYGIINYARKLSEESRQYGLINLRGRHSRKRWSSGPERWWNPEISFLVGKDK
ncbi:MAG: protein kinase, partial [Nanoarchaeota archaeon]